MTENMEEGDDPMQEPFSEDMQCSTHTKIPVSYTHLTLPTIYSV